jgi:hypothetical protein
MAVTAVLAGGCDDGHLAEITTTHGNIPTPGGRPRRGGLNGYRGGLFARSVEFPDFSARYRAPGSIAGHRRGVKGCGRFRVYLATQRAVLESKAHLQKRGQASPDDGDALALTFAQPVESAEVEELD